MPNWCDNTLKIYHLDKCPELDEKFGGPAISKIDNLFSLFLPVPEPLRGVTIKYVDQERIFVKEGKKVSEEMLSAWSAEHGYDNWYDWSVANWGSKWDTDAVASRMTTDHGVPFLALTFDTAWSPAEAFVIEISSQYPELVFELGYFEPGMDFYGYMQCHGGRVTGEWSENGVHEYNNDTDTSDYTQEFKQFAKEHL